MNAGSSPKEVTASWKSLTGDGLAVVLSTTCRNVLTLNRNSVKPKRYDTRKIKARKEGHCKEGLPGNEGTPNDQTLLPLG